MCENGLGQRWRRLDFGVILNKVAPILTR